MVIISDSGLERLDFYRWSIKTDFWKINVRLTIWVSKYSPNLVGQEKYHNIPLKPTGFYKTGHNAQFDREVKLNLWRHSYVFFSRNQLKFSWQHALWSCRISNRYHKFGKSNRRFLRSSNAALGLSQFVCEYPSPNKCK